MKEYWDNFTSSEKDMFQRVCRRLLKNTFIVRDKDDENRKAYFFVSKNPEPFTEYFGYIGFDIVVDRDNGVIMLQNFSNQTENGRIQANRYGMLKFESIILCCLWTLYVDKISTGSLKKTISVSVTDLRFELEKYGLKDSADNKTMTANALKTLSKFSLVDVTGKLGEPDCRILLYPSLQFALNGEQFRQFVEDASKRMKDKRGAEYPEEEFDDSDEE
ncbi:MAG: DUF4194 domain-containing protein [Lachnospiraceae bacterium]|nr:DUF4194 domain-containing protein [Lachnospiraceae bacterium]